MQAPKSSSQNVQGIAFAQVFCIEVRYFVTFNIFGLEGSGGGGEEGGGGGGGGGKGAAREHCSGPLFGVGGEWGGD